MEYDSLWCSMEKCRSPSVEGGGEGLMADRRARSPVTRGTSGLFLPAQHRATSEDRTQKVPLTFSPVTPNLHPPGTRDPGRFPHHADGRAQCCCSMAATERKGRSLGNAALYPPPPPKRCRACAVRTDTESPSTPLITGR